MDLHNYSTLIPIPNKEVDVHVSFKRSDKVGTNVQLVCKAYLCM